MVLGVARSGTTLLKTMLDHHSELAIPGESYFLPPLWRRYRANPDIERLLADLGHVAQIRQWGLTAADVRSRLPDRPAFPDVIRAIYESYAGARGKRRFGDKTPLYMRELALLEHAFSGPRYVHIIRDGRDGALSFGEMPRRPRSWDWPQGHADFARRWRDEVRGARRFGAEVGAGRYLEIRYEELVARPEPKLREICAFLELPFEGSMLEYHLAYGTHEPPPVQPRLAEPPSPGSRNWRDQMASSVVERFEAIAGPLLSELGYERAFPRPSVPARARSILDQSASRGRSVTARIPRIIHRCTPLWRWWQSR